MKAPIHANNTLVLNMHPEVKNAVLAHFGNGGGMRHWMDSEIVPFAHFMIERQDNNDFSPIDPWMAFGRSGTDDKAWANTYKPPPGWVKGQRTTALRLDKTLVEDIRTVAGRSPSQQTDRWWRYYVVPYIWFRLLVWEGGGIMPINLNDAYGHL